MSDWGRSVLSALIGGTEVSSVWTGGGISDGVFLLVRYDTIPAAQKLRRGEHSE
jgi:hypothetical protein